MSHRVQRRWLLMAIGVASVVLLPVLLYGFSRHSNKQPAAAIAPAGSTAEAVVAAAPGQVDVLGGTRHLSAQADGVVRNVIAVGDQRLSAGAILLQLDDRQSQLESRAAALDVERLELNIAALNAQAHGAAAEIDRLKPLVVEQAEPADVLRQAEVQQRSVSSALRLAQVDLAAGKLHLHLLALHSEQQRIRAPVAGRVLRVDVRAGESVSRDTPVIWFEPDAAPIVRAELDERLIARLHVGMRAEVEAEYGGGRVFPAHLTGIAAHIGPARLPVDGEIESQDNRIVECTLALGSSNLLLGQRVLVRFLESP